MFVKNVTGSSRFLRPRGYDSWLDYWEKNSGQIFIPKKCPTCGRNVTRKELDGCHVQKANNPFDGRWYIVPLCDRYNHSKEKLDVGNIPLVPTPSNL
jgi:hypothetical protein